MALANIQHIAIKQGPLQRMLGIADVEVRNAGGGSSPAGAKGQEGMHHEPAHVGYFRGVDCAEEIRELLREGVRRQRDGGLGDPDEPVHAAASSDATLAEARRLLEAARAVRAVLDPATRVP